jgi:hypothetical protein
MTHDDNDARAPFVLLRLYNAAFKSRTDCSLTFSHAFEPGSNMELSFLLIIVLLVYNVLSTRILVCVVQVGAHPQSTIIERLNNLDHKCLYPQIRCKIIW